MVYVEYDNILTFVFALPPFLLLLLPFIMALAIAIDYNGGKPWWILLGMDGWGSRKWGEGRRGKLGGMVYDLE